MSKRARRNYIHAMSHLVNHKKMYKAKKHWVVASMSLLALTGLSLLSFGSGHVHADTTNKTVKPVVRELPSTNSSASVKNTKASEPNLQKLFKPSAVSTKASNAPVLKSNTNSAKAEPNNNKVASNDAGFAKNSATHNIPAENNVGRNSYVANLNHLFANANVRAGNIKATATDTGNLVSRYTNSSNDTHSSHGNGDGGTVSAVPFNDEYKWGSAYLRYDGAGTLTVENGEIDAPISNPYDIGGPTHTWYTANWNSAGSSNDHETGTSGYPDNTPQYDIEDSGSKTGYDNKYPIIWNAKYWYVTDESQNSGNYFGNVDSTHEVTLAPGDVTRIVFHNVKLGDNVSNLLGNNYLPNLKSIQIDGMGGLSSSHTTNMSNMFANQPHLSEIDGLGNLSTNNVNDMSGMFENDSKLATLNLNGFDINSSTNVNNMLNGTNSLTKLILPSSIGNTGLRTNILWHNINNGKYTNDISTLSDQTGTWLSSPNSMIINFTDSDNNNNVVGHKLIIGESGDDYYLTPPSGYYIQNDSNRNITFANVIEPIDVKENHDYYNVLINGRLSPKFTGINSYVSDIQNDSNYGNSGASLEIKNDSSIITSASGHIADLSADADDNFNLAKASAAYTAASEADIDANATASYASDVAEVSASASVSASNSAKAAENSANNSYRGNSANIATNSSNINTDGGLINSLHNEASELNNSATDFSNSDKSLNSSANTLWNSDSNLNTSLGDLYNYAHNSLDPSIIGNSQSISRLFGSDTTLNSRANSADSEFGSANTRFSNDEGNIGTRFGNDENSIVANSQNIRSLFGSTASLNNRAVSADTRFGSADSRFNSVDNKFNDVNTSLTKLSGSINTNAQGIASNNSNIQKNISKINSNSTSINNNYSRITRTYTKNHDSILSLDSEYRNLGNTVANNNYHLNKYIDSVVTQVGNNYDTIVKDENKFGSRLTNLDDKLTEDTKDVKSKLVQDVSDNRREIIDYVNGVKTVLDGKLNSTDSKLTHKINYNSEHLSYELSNDHEDSLRRINNTANTLRSETNQLVHDTRHELENKIQDNTNRIKNVNAQDKARARNLKNDINLNDQRIQKLSDKEKRDYHYLNDSKVNKDTFKKAVANLKDALKRSHDYLKRVINVDKKALNDKINSRSDKLNKKMEARAKKLEARINTRVGMKQFRNAQKKRDEQIKDLQTEIYYLHAIAQGLHNLINNDDSKLAQSIRENGMHLDELDVQKADRVELNRDFGLAKTYAVELNDYMDRIDANNGRLFSKYGKELNNKNHNENTRINHVKNDLNSRIDNSDHNISWINHHSEMVTYTRARDYKFQYFTPVRDVWVHSNLNFSRNHDNVITTWRPSEHIVAKIIGVYTIHGKRNHVRLEVKIGHHVGYVTGRKGYVADAYAPHHSARAHYLTNHDVFGDGYYGNYAVVQTRKPCNVYHHRWLSGKPKRHLRAHYNVLVRRIVRSNGRYRLQLADGGYMTDNSAFLRVL